MAWAVHLMQLELVPAPGPAYDPAGQTPSHNELLLVPALPNRPAAQLLHDVTLDSIEYVPAVHGMQREALELTPVSVLDPALHVVHSAVVPAPSSAYDPAGHAPLHNADVPAPLSA